jgi:hypothetical protein
MRRAGDDMAKSRKAKQSKTGQGGNLKEATLLIPLTYNDGTEVPRDVRDSILEELFVAFQGWTIEGTIKGAYAMRATGQKRVEELQKVSVILEEARLAELEDMIARWCARLVQEVMLLKIADYIIKFIPPQPETEQP